MCILSKEYINAIAAHDAVQVIYKEVRDLHREGKVTEIEFVEAWGEMKKADEIFDVAFAKEAE